MDFKIILHRCSPGGVVVSFETFVHERTLTHPSLYPSPPPPQKKKKKEKKKFQIRISCQFIEKYSPPPKKKKWILCQKNSLTTTPPPSPPLAQTTHTSHRPSPRPFFSDLDYLPTWFSVSEYFLQFDKSKSKKISFFLLAGGGGGVVAGGGEHNVQMFQMALLVFKEYKCAKLFWNACLNTVEMAQTSSIYDHFIIWLQVCPWHITFPNKCFKWLYYSSRRTSVQNYF